MGSSEVPRELDSVIAAWRTERPDLDMAPLRISMLLRRVMERLERRRGELLAAYDLTPSGLDLLAALRRSGPPFRQTPSDLARGSLLTAGGISQRLARLEAAGLIARSMDPSDRRVVRVEFTAKGRRTIDAVLGPYMEQEEQLLSGLSARRRSDLERLLVSLLASD